MDRNELLKELHAHGFHMTTVLSTDPHDLAKGIGLLLLGLEELLAGRAVSAKNGRPAYLSGQPHPSASWVGGP